MYLLIENPGIVPIEALTVIGLSTTRYAQKEGSIGQFGSGSKASLALFLRNNLNVVIFSDKTRLDFYTEPLKISTSSRTFPIVKYKIGGQLNGGTVNRTEQAGYSTDWGVQDWSEIAFGLREFVSNALDASLENTGVFDNAIIDIVQPNQVRAKSGKTRVFVPFNSDVQKFLNELDKRFLHFKDKKELKMTILPKDNRNITGRKTAVIYKSGVYIRELDELYGESLYDYNFGNELTLDEARNVTDSLVKLYASRAIGKAPPSILAHVMGQTLSGKKFFENNLDSYYLKGEYDSEEIKETKKKNWQTAWRTVAGDNGVPTHSLPHVISNVERKGFKAFVVDDNTLSILKHFGVKTDFDVLTGVEKEGLQKEEPTQTVIKGIDKVWSTFELLDLTNGKTKPPVFCFNRMMDGGETFLGLYKDGEVLIHKDISNDQGAQLLKTLIEEVVHHVYGCNDCTRDMQEAFLCVISKMFSEFYK